MEIFLPITGRNDRSPVARQDNLPAMSMSTQHEADTAVANGLNIVRVMRQKEHRIAFGGIIQGGVQILMISPEITNATNAKPGTTTLDPDTRVVQIWELRFGERGL